MEDNYNPTPEETAHMNAVIGLQQHFHANRELMFDLLDGTYHRWRLYYKKHNDRPDDTDCTYMVHFMKDRISEFYDEANNEDYAALNHDQQLLQQAEIVTHYLAEKLAEQLER